MKRGDALIACMDDMDGMDDMDCMDVGGGGDIVRPDLVGGKNQVHGG